MTENTIFIIVLTASLAFFAWSCFVRFRFITLGKRDDRFHSIFKRLWNMIFYAFAQERVRSRPFGYNHAILFWSFLVLCVANGEFIVSGPHGSLLSLLPVWLHGILAFIFDIVSLLVLICVGIAVIRRLVFPPPYIEAKSRDAFVILGLIAALMIAYYGMYAAEIALNPNYLIAGFMPVSSFLAAALFSNATEGWVTFFWWAHALILLGFLNYLPYSKHMHVLTAIPNCFFKHLLKIKVQSREEFKKENVYGVGRVDEFTWKSLFDSYSCTECGRCNQACPATCTDKPLNPRLVIHDIKANLLKNGPQIIKKKDIKQPLIGDDGEGSVSEDSIWACTTCGACMEECPVFIEHVPKIVEMRRNLIEMKSKFPEELFHLFENMEARSNPWGLPPAKRGAWAEEVGAKPFEKDNTEYLFYVGCAGAFDSRSKHITLAVSKILNAAGVSWGVLGKDELCCGDSARRLGNEFVFNQMVHSNIEMFREKNIKKIITLCPHCFSTLKNDYRQYNIELEVLHYTELIDQFIKEGKIRLNRTEALGNTVFHDSCYLGRYNEIYEAPRKAIEEATGTAPKEIKRHGSKSSCCGAGGGRMWLEETIGTRINEVRLEEAMQENPKTICTSCPYCMTMFEDGVKTKNVEDKIQIKDVAEIVADALE